MNHRVKSFLIVTMLCVVVARHDMMAFSYVFNYPLFEHSQSKSYNQFHEELPYHVSTVGFRMIADALYDDPKIHPGGYNPLYERTLERNKISVDSIKDHYPIIYVNTRRIPNFLVEMEPRIKQPYILILHGNDETIPNDYYLTAMHKFLHVDMDKLLNNKKIKHFFIQNYIGPHSKNVTTIPLGINFQVLKALRPQGVTGSPIEQSHLLTALAKSSLPTQARMHKVLMNAHLNKRSDRDSKRFSSIGVVGREQQVIELRKNPLVVFQDKKLPRKEAWELATKYAFVYSPVGAGLDCYRVWESIALGQIVLVQSTPLDHLYKDLPVIPIKDLSDINQENLERWLAKFGDVRANKHYQEKVSMKYWQNLVHEKSKKSMNGSDKMPLKLVSKILGKVKFVRLGGVSIKF